MKGTRKPRACTKISSLCEVCVVFRFSFSRTRHFSSKSRETATKGIKDNFIISVAQKSHSSWRRRNEFTGLLIFLSVDNIFIKLNPYSTVSFVFSEPVVVVVLIVLLCVTRYGLFLWSVISLRQVPRQAPTANIIPQQSLDGGSELVVLSVSVCLANS